MSRKGKLSAAVLLVLVGAVGVATNANALQPRKHCQPNNWWHCATEPPVIPQPKAYRSTIPVNQIDTRAEAMQNAGGGGGGGGGGGR